MGMKAAIAGNQGETESEIAEIAALYKEVRARSETLAASLSAGATAAAVASETLTRASKRLVATPPPGRFRVAS